MPQSGGRNILDIIDSHRAAQTISPLEQPRSLNHLHRTVPVNGPLDALDDEAFIPGLSGSFHVPGAAGFSLRYDNSTPLRSVDVGGRDQAERMTQFVTSAIDNLSHGLSVDKAYKDLELNSPQDPIPGMQVRLLPHQAIGVAWMLSREKHHDKGGILADDMGLGKTIQMIACMIKNLPPLDAKYKTTLIVVPAALLQQWKDEIESKTNDVFTVHVHHGRDRLQTTSQVRSYDVVITTYQTLSQDFNAPSNLDPEDVDDWLKEHGGVLARSKFYRAIVDEAQFIRNRSTVSSLSCAYVKATYRWLLTGTPVTNTLADIYGLIRFGHFRPWNDWKDFNEHVAKMQAKDAVLAGQRAQAILQPLILRRTKDSQLEGKPILHLPEKHIDLVTLEFSKEERAIYTAFETKTQVQINRFIRTNTLMKNHAYVLVLLLRLRQLCCHPYLTLSIEGEGEMSQGGTVTTQELARARRVMGKPWVESIKRRFLLRARVNQGLVNVDASLVDSDSCPVCKEVYVGDAGRVLPCGHQICFDCLVELHTNEIAHDGIFGQGSDKENIAQEKEYENAKAKGLRPCPSCKKMTNLKGSQIFKSTAFEPTDEEVRAQPSFGSHSKKRTYVSDSCSDSDSEDEVKPAVSSSKRTIDLDNFDDMLADSDDDLVDPCALAARSKQMQITPPKKKKARLSFDSDEEGSLSTRNSPSMKHTTNDLSDTEDSDVDMHSPSRHKARKGARRSRLGKGATNSMGISSTVLALWNRGDDDLEPSTKMSAMLNLLKEWDSSGEKTIVYSQWTANIDLLEKLFSRHGIRNLRFDGSMDRKERDEILAQFKSPRGPKVICISTRAGSVGLNLVAANRVINMDLSWNYAAESQAYDRVHRIGQEKEVFVKRLVIKGTIEERMLKLQDVKVGLAEAALGEGKGGKLQKFSVKDIKYLFGMSGNSNDKKQAQNARSTPSQGGSD